MAVLLRFEHVCVAVIGGGSGRALLVCSLAHDGRASLGSRAPLVFCLCSPLVCDPLAHAAWLRTAAALGSALVCIASTAAAGRRSAVVLGSSRRACRSAAAERDVAGRRAAAETAADAVLFVRRR